VNIEQDLPLIILPDRLAVCRLPSDSAHPDWARPGELLAFIHTRDELSVVCAERFVPPEVKAERGWRALQVQGPLDFALVGVIASITKHLARAGVSVFALSTFDTDYILVKEESLEKATQALLQAGFLVMTDVDLPS
jgi:hypothetical protein